MRDQNSTKKTRRWPPRVGKRHRHEGNAPAEHAPKSETPGHDVPPQDERAAPLEQPRREAVVISRRNRLRDAVARRRQSHAPVTG